MWIGYGLYYCGIPAEYAAGLYMEGVPTSLKALYNKVEEGGIQDPPRYLWAENGPLRKAMRLHAAAGDHDIILSLEATIGRFSASLPLVSDVTAWMDACLSSTEDIAPNPTNIA